MTRRDALRVGTLGLGGLTLADMLRLKRAPAGQDAVKDTSVIWIWLGGGPTQIETFDPKMTAPSEYRSVTGEVSTTLSGMTIGGNFPKLARMTDKMAVVRSFAY